MQLFSISLNGKVRIIHRQNGVDVRDQVFNIFANTGRVDLSKFGDLFFYMLPSNVLSDSDGTNPVATGFSFELVDVNGNIVQASGLVKVDVYETANNWNYLIQFNNIQSSVGNTFASDVYIRRIDVIYQGQNVNTSQLVRIPAFKTTEPEIIPFAEQDPNTGLYGYRIQSGYDVHFNLEAQLSVPK